MKKTSRQRPISKQRTTRETDIHLNIVIEGDQRLAIDTPHPFFNHLLEQLAFHAGWNLDVLAKGDLEVDDHHLVEDVALVLGAALEEGWHNRADLKRYGQRLLPMDETLVLCAVDLSGRPFCDVRLDLKRETVGGLATEMIPHFFHSLAMAGHFTLHLRQMAGANHHHIIEASFKALARALREAFEPSGLASSTKELG